MAKGPFPPLAFPEGEGCGLGDNARAKGPGLGVGFMASPDPGRETSLVGQDRVTGDQPGGGKARMKAPEKGLAVAQKATQGAMATARPRSPGRKGPVLTRHSLPSGAGGLLTSLPGGAQPIDMEIQTCHPSALKGPVGP